MKQSLTPSVTGFPPEDFLAPQQRLDAIMVILAKGVLRLIEKQAQESREDKAFGDTLATEIASLPGGAS
jgi:hypothetical protein